MSWPLKNVVKPPKPLEIAKSPINTGDLFFRKAVFNDPPALYNRYIGIKRGLRAGITPLAALPFCPAQVAVAFAVACFSLSSSTLNAVKGKDHRIPHGPTQTLDPATKNCKPNRMKCLTAKYRGMKYLRQIPAANPQKINHLAPGNGFEAGGYPLPRPRPQCSTPARRFRSRPRY
jgi:hypothetical protein